MRKHFDELFATYKNDIFEPQVIVLINGISIGTGFRFGGKVSFGNIDLTKCVGKEFEVKIKNGIYNVKGYFDYHRFPVE